MMDELGTVRYTYDANGNVLTVEDANGKIIRKYDALNRITEYTDYRGNTVQYSYDQIGNLVALTYPGGEIVRYTYYKNGWLHTVTDTVGKVTTYEYDCNGNMTRCTRPNGTVEICTYDAAGMLVNQKDVKIVSDGGGGCQELPYVEEILTEYTYTYDERGNITTISGTETTDDISTLKSAEMTYDADNRIISYNGQVIRYDADGNMTYGPVNGVMSELVYDCRNRLVSAGGVRYTYDAENIRIAVETDEYVEEYVTDMVSSSLSRILIATRYAKDTSGTRSATGDVTTYIYGYGLISEYQGDIVLYHHYNNLGSTMKLTDAFGNEVASYTYGAYGELLSGDTGFTDFLYNGRCGVMTDDNGLYYMRQRYYNTEIKRFINQDVIRGSLTNSQSLNRYSYVQGNPVSYTDPFGLSPINGLFSGTNAIHNALLIGNIVLPEPFGALCDFVDGTIYLLVDHDVANALGSYASIVAPGAVGLAFRGINKLHDMSKSGMMISKLLGKVSAEATQYGDDLASYWFKSDAQKILPEMSKADELGSLTKIDDDVLDWQRTSKGLQDVEVPEGACFVAGTQIKTESGSKSIEEIEVGDFVYAKSAETGETGYRRVVRLFRKESTELIHLQIGDVVIDATPSHPFWVDGYGFKPAGDLKEGDYVETANGELLPVLSVEKEYLDEPVTVYNFEVEGWHTYYVSDEEIFVHNMCALPTGKGGSYTPKNKTSLWGQEKYVTEKGLNTVKQHLSGDLADEFNDSMIARLESAYKNNTKISGADLDFYAHEIYEANMMKKGMNYNDAHNAAKSYYNATEFNFYHPDVIKANPKLFNKAWFEFWGIERN